MVRGDNKLSNERNTSNLFRQLLDESGYTADSGFNREEEQSRFLSIKKLLSKSSKSKTGKGGYPDFIVSRNLRGGGGIQDTILVVECKAKTSDFDKAKAEAKWYTDFLLPSFNVISIALAGELREDYRLHWAVYKKTNATDAIEPMQQSSSDDNRLLSYIDYVDIVECNHEITEQNIIKELDNIKSKIDAVLSKVPGMKYNDKMLLVSACLIALRKFDSGALGFRERYSTYTSQELLDEVIRACERNLNKYMKDDASGKVQTILKSLRGSLDKYIPLKESGDTNAVKRVLDIIDGSSIHRILEDGNRPLNIDIMSEFYEQFIGYSSDNQQAKAGFVITPRHICELCIELAGLTDDSKVLDPCFGTGGFLVAALKSEIKYVNDTYANQEREKRILNIKNNNIYGIELDQDNFTYGCVNMILRGDGHSNMQLGSCFDTEIKDRLSKAGFRAGFINPPYSRSSANELKFVLNMLDMLSPGAQAFAIVPCGTVLDTKGSEYTRYKHAILDKHKLVACIKLPTKLFNPYASVSTCLLVFEAHVKHDTETKTWLANLNFDGISDRRRSKIDTEEWYQIKADLRSAYKNGDKISTPAIEGNSFLIGPDDIWLYQAHKVVDYETLSDKDFKQVVFNYAIFELEYERLGLEVIQQ